MRSISRPQAPNGAPLVRRIRRGFTLIELLVVVVIIGILTAIAIPKFQSTRGKAYFAGMRSDLRNLMTSQEAYFYLTGTYTTRLDSLAFSASRGNVVTITEATLTGWSATSENPESYPHFCAIFLGSAAAVSPATVAGQLACQ
jgi:type IV pilus assembly protein PilA